MRCIPLRCAIVLSAFAIVLLSVPASSQGRRVGQLEVENIGNRAAVAREVLVRWRGPIQPAQLAQIASGIDAESAEAVGRAGVVRVRSRSLSAAALLAAFSKRPDVAYVEPNFVVRTFAEPSDPLFP